MNEMVVDSALPWGLKLRIAGKEYKTRPLRVVDLKKLERFDQLSDEDGFALLNQLFVDPKPALVDMADAGEIGAIDLLGIVQAVTHYFKESIGKNSKAIAAQIQGTATVANPAAAATAEVSS